VLKITDLFLFAYLAELVDATDLKFVFYKKCWFESNSE
jgi:hypothetical protein